MVIGSLLISCSTVNTLSMISEQHPSLAAYLSEKDIPTAAYRDPQFYYDGSTWSDRAVELIDGAERSILIDSFLIGEHVQTHRIIDAMERAVGRGVQVYLIFDSASYYRVDRFTGRGVPVPLQRIRDAGILITEYNPVRASRIYRLAGLFDRDHRKYWIIDQKTVVVGGMNIDADSLADPSRQGSIDGMTEICSPEAAALLTDAFISTWNAFSLEQLTTNAFSLEASVLEEDAGTMWVFNQGPFPQEPIAVMYDGLFTYAQRSVWMMQSYMILTPSLLSRISQAVDRGVSVHIILSANHISERFVKATYYGIRDLLDAGASVYIYESPTGSLLHKKLVVADDHLLSVGSANYNLRSQRLSREISLLFDDEQAVADMQQFIDEIRASSRPVTMEEAREYRSVSFYLSYLIMQLGG